MSCTTFIHFARGRHARFFPCFSLGMFSTSTSLFALKECSELAETAACMTVFRRERDGAVGFRIREPFYYSTRCHFRSPGAGPRRRSGGVDQGPTPERGGAAVNSRWLQPTPSVGPEHHATPDPVCDKVSVSPRRCSGIRYAPDRARRPRGARPRPRDSASPRSSTP